MLSLNRLSKVPLRDFKHFKNCILTLQNETKTVDDIGKNVFLYVFCFLNVFCPVYEARLVLML